MEDSCRIMIVDDEFIMRQGIRFMMQWETCGYEIAGEASNGREALEKIAELAPHIVLCDIAMPVMSGLEFIKVAHKEYPDIKIIVLSGYDNFEYVREALLTGASDYVLKPTLNPEELMTHLDKVASEIPGFGRKKRAGSDLDMMLEKFMTGEDGKADGRVTAALAGSCFRLFVLPLKCRDKNGVDLSQVIFDKAEDFFRQSSRFHYLKFLCNHKEVLCAVINYDIRDESRIVEELAVFAERLGMISDRAFVVCGQCRRSLTEIKDEFLDGNILAKEGFYYKGSHICFDTGEERRTLKKFDFRSFAASVSVGKYDDAIMALTEYVYEAADCRMQEFKLKNQTKNLLYSLISENSMFAAELESICRETFEQMEQTYWCEDFLQMFEYTVERIGGVLGSSRMDRDTHLGVIVDYIRENYAENLTLQSLAEQFGFSYSYLSAYFNQYAKEGFSEYLNKIRVQKACEYLEDSAHTIAEVSSAVGYSDHSYFCRVFKKMTGETPSSYRRERLKR